MKFDFTLTRAVNFEIDGKHSRGKLTIGGIEEQPGNDTDRFWICYWSLDEIHPERGHVFGLDALDSLVNCIMFIQSLIERHSEIGYKIWWCEEGDDIGLTLKK